VNGLNLGALRELLVQSRVALDGELQAALVLSGKSDPPVWRGA